MSTKEELLAAAEVNLERHDGLLAELIETAIASLNKPELEVWCNAMPESNGKKNYTAILIRKGGNLHDGMTIDRSEYPGRTRWAADRVAWLIGQREDRPCMTEYDHNSRSDYAYPATKLSEAQCVVLTGFTGVLFGKFSTFHADAEKRLGRPIWTHEFATAEMKAELKETYRQDFMALQP